MSLTSMVTVSAALLGSTAPHRPPVSTELKVESLAGQVLVHVTIHNRGATSIHVPRALAADPQPFGKTFTLTAEPGAASIGYTGPMVKRGPIGPDDFIVVKPHSTLRHTLDISRSYAFLPGEHAYTLQYVGGAVANLAQLDRMMPLAPASAQFVHTGPAP